MEIPLHEVNNIYYNVYMNAIDFQSKLFLRFYTILKSTTRKRECIILKLTNPLFCLESK